MHSESGMFEPVIVRGRLLPENEQKELHYSGLNYTTVQREGKVWGRMVATKSGYHRNSHENETSFLCCSYNIHIMQCITCPRNETFHFLPIALYSLSFTTLTKDKLINKANNIILILRFLSSSLTKFTPSQPFLSNTHIVNIHQLSPKARW